VGEKTVGTLYRITTNGTYTQLYTFASAIGSGPNAAPLQHTNGTFYGTAEFGGKYGEGSLYSLDMGLGPFITFVQPTGAVGKTAQILGQGLTGTISVIFNGIAATNFKVASDTFMLPPCAVASSSGCQ
jgi:uncharacterized repeat protein (TIGR03803 family)